MTIHWTEFINDNSFEFTNQHTHTHTRMLRELESTSHPPHIVYVNPFSVLIYSRLSWIHKERERHTHVPSITFQRSHLENCGTIINAIHSYASWLVNGANKSDEQGLRGLITPSDVLNFLSFFTGLSFTVLNAIHDVFKMSTSCDKFAVNRSMSHVWNLGEAWIPIRSAKCDSRAFPF